MKHINIIITLIALTLIGCSSSKSMIKTGSAENKKEVECFNTCTIFAECARKNRGIFSDHDISLCALECMSLPDDLTSAVSTCAKRTLKGSCDAVSMNICVKALTEK